MNLTVQQRYPSLYNFYSLDSGGRPASAKDGGLQSLRSVLPSPTQQCQASLASIGVVVSPAQALQIVTDLNELAALSAQQSAVQPKPAAPAPAVVPQSQPTTGVK